MTPPGDEVSVRLRVKEQRKFNEDMDRSGRKVRDFGDESDRAGKKVKSFNANINLMRNVLNLVRPVALITGLGLAAQAMSAAGAGAVALVGALAPLTGMLATYPGLGLAAAQGMFAFKVGMLGMQGPLSKITDRLKQPSPLMQKFTEHLRGFTPQLVRLRNIAQKPLLEGLTKSVGILSPMLGKFDGIVRGTGGALGGLAVQGAHMVAGWGGDLQKVGRNNITVIRNFGGGALGLADALRHVVVVAQPLVLWVSRLTKRWGEGLAAAAATGRETGKLADFFAKTRNVMTTVMHIGGGLAKSLWNIGKAGAPLGRTILRDLNEQVQKFAEWTGSAAGQNKLRKWFADSKPAIYEIARLVRDVTKAFFSLGNQPGVASLIKQVRTQLLPVFVDLVGNTTKAFGPHLVNALTQIGILLGNMAGSSGPLVIFVDSLAAGAKALNWFFKAVPGAHQLFVTFVGLSAVMKAMRFGAMVSGIGTMIGALAAQRAAMVASTGATNVSTAAALRWRASQIAASISGKATTVTMIGQRIATVATTVATRAAAAATWLWNAATKAMTLASLALNLAMRANPIIFIVTALVLLVAGLVLAYNKVDWFRNAVNAAFHAIASVVSSVVGFIKDHWKLILPILLGPVGIAVALLASKWGAIKSAAGAVVTFIKNRWNDLMGFFSGLPGRIGNAFSGAFDGIKNAFRSAVNFIIDGWNNLRFHIGGTDLGPLGHMPDININTPDIPRLARGGLIRNTGAALVGEYGPELLSLPMGARVEPLPMARVPAYSSAVSAGAGDLDGLDLGAMLGLPPLHLYIDGREVAVAVHRHASDADARS